MRIRDIMIWKRWSSRESVSIGYLREIVHSIKYEMDFFVQNPKHERDTSNVSFFLFTYHHTRLFNFLIPWYWYLMMTCVKIRREIIGKYERRVFLTRFKVVKYGQSFFCIYHPLYDSIIIELSDNVCATCSKTNDRITPIFLQKDVVLLICDEDHSSSDFGLESDVFGVIVFWSVNFTDDFRHNVALTSQNRTKKKTMHFIV